MPTPLDVILNDRPLRQPLTGVGHYIRQLLIALREHAADAVRVHAVLFPDAGEPNWQPRGLRTGGGASTSGASPRGVGLLRAPWWLRRIAQSAYAVYFRRRARGHTLYHEPNHIPVRCDLPTVTTIHDLSVLTHPEWHPADRARWYERDFAAGLTRTTRFIAASEFTRGEMVSRLGLPGDRIDVIYQAPRPAFTVTTKAAGSVGAADATADPAAGRILERHGLVGPYFLYVGTLEPRKNVPLLLDAFAALPAAVRQECQLALAGPWGWKAESLREQLASRGCGDRIRLLGYLTDDELAALYSSPRCLALVWPTWYEGFGLPPLEALACGAPVIASRVASLPEVVGGAGVLLDPADPGPWTEALRRAVEDPAWRPTFRERALRQAARFSWRRCAEETVATYRAAVGAAADAAGR